MAFSLLYKLRDVDITNKSDFFTSRPITLFPEELMKMLISQTFNQIQAKI